MRKVPVRRMRLLASRATAFLTLFALVLASVLTVSQAPAYASASFPIVESFGGSAPGWVLGGNAFLNGGWLTLTRPWNDQSGFAYYSQDFSSSLGIVVDFDYASWGGSGADGTSFFLFDGATTNFTPGPRGGALGYAARPYSGVSGISNAYVGIGLDEWGNFSSPYDGLNGGPGQIGNSIAVRGPGNGTSGYAYLTGATNYSFRGDRNAGRHIQMTISKDKKITVRVRPGLGQAYQTVINGYQLPSAPPPTLKLGFSASTGGSTNYHEIRNVTISVPVDLPTSMTSSAGTAVVSAGQQITYTVNTSNIGLNDANGSTINLTANGLTNLSWTCSAAAGASCANASGTGTSAGVNLPVNGNVTLTVKATVAANAAGSVSLSAAATAPSGYTNTSTSSSVTLTNGVTNDTTPPVTTVVSGAPGSTGVTVTLKATDPDDTVANTYYQVDNAPAQTGTSVLVTGGGLHTLTYWSVDSHGNKETAKAAQVFVDPTTVAPAITSATAGYVGPASTLAGTAEPNSTVNIYLDTDPSNTNLALKHPVVQSSNAFGSDGSAAVNGVLTGGFQAHTGNEPSPWWQVDLGQVSAIDNFVVWNRYDCCAYREDTLSILISNDGTTWQRVGGANNARFGGINPTNGLLIQGLGADNVTRSGLIGPLKVYGQGVAARYVRLQISTPGSLPLNFDQFQAFGTSAMPVATVKADASGNWSANLSALTTGSHTVYAKSYGAAATAVSSATLTVDATAPTIIGAATPAANAAGWNNSQVTVHFTCADADSGVASCSPDTLLKKEGANQSVTGTAVDNAGNTATATVSGVNIDLTAPVTTATAPTGWQNKPATVTLTATDNLSGVAGTYYTVDGGAAQQGNAVTINTDGKHTVGYYSVDKAGNAEGGAVSLQVPANVPWYDTGIDVVAGTTLNVTASGTAYYCSGCATTPNGSNQGVNTWLVPNAPALGLVGKIGNGSGFFVGANYSGVAAGSGRLYLAMNDLVGAFNDNYGSWNATVTTNNTLTVMVDQTPPTISGSASTTAWTNAPVMVTFTCADATSGVQSCQAPITVSLEGANQSVTGTAVDNAGNTASVTVSGINIDKTAPSTTISAPTTWQNKDVPVTFTATDNLSGVAATYYTVDGGAQQTGTSLTLSTEGVHTLTYWSVDKAGNAEAAHTATVKIDKTPPTISGATDRAANAAGWYNADVKVTFTCADPLSGGVASGVATCSAPSTLTEGANQSVTGTSTDVAGNTASATVSGINIDKTPPTILGKTDRVANGFGWYNAPVAVTFSCADSLSGIDAGRSDAGCGGSTTLNQDGAAQSVTGSATDKAGNTSSATVSGINIDQTAPTIAISFAGTTQDGAYVNSVTPTIKVDDAVSGIDPSQTVITLNGAPFTSGTAVTAPGSYTLTVAIADKAGNPATQTVQFKVRHTTALKYVGDVTADYNDPATLTAVLTDTATATPVALSGQSVSLSVGLNVSRQTCSGSTDSSGAGTCSIIPNVAAGAYPIGVSYAGSDLYYSSSASGSFTVNKEETALHITSSNTLNTNNVVVTAQLQEDGTTAIAGRTVTFTAVGSSGTTVTGTGVTDATGKATATLNLSPDQYSLSASFAGDGYYVASSDKQTLYVYQQTQFVIWGGNAGGLQTGADYNFWGAQWSKQVTGGNYQANASFKGYADTVSGATWTATPGGSSNPPATVAKYISVLVATQATKSGNKISGNVFEIVVLKVDATPAYGPTPSTPGSGILMTVVH